MVLNAPSRVIVGHHNIPVSDVRCEQPFPTDFIPRLYDSFLPQLSACFQCHLPGQT